MRSCWSNQNIIEALKFYDEGLNSTQIAEKINRTPKAVRVFFNKKKLYFGTNPEKINVVCLRCDLAFEKHKSETRKYCIECCDHLHKETVARKLFLKEKRDSAKLSLQCDQLLHKNKKCLNCDQVIELDKHFRVNKFCNKECDNAYKSRMIDVKVLSGEASHATTKRYLIRKHGAVCMECGWSKVNPYTQTIPVELEHIDGNSENNHLSNLKLLCPNCHSLTPTYKGANMGNGRHARRERYKEGKSF